MTEQEEFEFRLRLEREQKAAPAEGSRARAAKQSDGLLTKALLNVVPGAIRGAASIGNTIMLPFDAAVDLIQGRGPLESNRQYRQDADNALQNFGADPTNPGYKAGKLGAEVAGTLGVGGVAANALGRIGPATPALLDAVRTGGMTAGGVTGVGGLGLRAAGGGVNGGLSAGLVDPESAGKGAAIAAVLPMGVRTAGAAGNALRQAADGGSQRLMQSALKPTIEQLRKGEAATAVDTLLAYGISPTKKGVVRLNDLIDDLNNRVSSEIAASSATVDKGNVLNALAGTRQRFGNQVSPTADLNAIQRVADDFTAHPNLPGSVIPVQTAQSMKQGTYQVLKGKYGEAGSAETEAQKALARGLKEEIATAVPAVGPLNAEESRLLTTLSVAERRVLMDANKNPMGLSLLASNPKTWAMFMADKSAAFKALAARMISAAAPVASTAGANLLGAAQSPLLRNSAVIGAGTNP